MKNTQNHPSRETLESYVRLAPERELTNEEDSLVTSHVKLCKDCAEFVEEVARQEEDSLLEKQFDVPWDTTPLSAEEKARADTTWERIKPFLTTSDQSIRS